MRPVPTQANDSIVGDIRMEDRRLPGKVGHQPWISRPELDQAFVMISRLDNPAGIPIDTLAFKNQPVLLRRFATGEESQNTTFVTQFTNRFVIRF